jgi:ferric-dicitrate binding protein FerR (iron transport regulator)
MHWSSLRNIFCWLLLAVVPASLLGANSGAAMLYAQGTAWLNGASVPGTSAVFPGDLVQTKGDAVVHITATGSSVMIFSDSLVKYEGNTVSLEHGTVRVATTQGMSIRAGEVAVQPARANDATDFDVSDVDGTVHITARKGDVSVSKGTETARLAQGEQTTREDRDDTQKPKKKRRAGGAVPAAGGPLLDSPYALAIGVTAVGVPLAWVLSQGDDPLSPVEP